MPYWPFVKRLPWLLLGILGMPSNSQAQTSNAPKNAYSQVNIASPTAAALGKFVDVPVNYHTGIPQINVPLYTVKEGSLALPLSLNYHAGGVKVQEPAGWVGTGWALNAGGVITRAVLGTPDECNTTIATKGHFSDYGYSNYLTIGGHLPNGDPAPNGAAFANSTYDGEPDLFFFNFNGYSGKFYFSDDRTPVILDGQDLKISYYYPRESTGSSVNSLADNNIGGFIITVPTGDKYYFGITDNLPYGSTSNSHEGAKPVDMSYTDSGESPGVDNVIYSSYYLSKIVAADGVHTIYLTYEREKYSYYTILTFPVENPTSLQNQGFQLASINIDGARLANIKFSAGTVAFHAAANPRTDLSSYLTGDPTPTEAKALDNIEVASSDFCKRFSFAYSYFSGDATPLAAGLRTTSGNAIQSDQTRLKLDSVWEQSCDGAMRNQPWRFTYNGTFLPRRLSFAQDHWGFYNGVARNSLINTLIPSIYAPASTSSTATISELDGANRDSNAQAMLAGILTQVIYPTGGSATFVYEPHDVWARHKTAGWQQVDQHTAGSGFGQAPEQTFNLAFSGNTYKLTLDYQRNPLDRYNGTVFFTPDPGPLRGLIVGENNGHLLHAESIQTPARGTIKCSMYADVATGNGEGAILQLYEYIDRTDTRNDIVGGLRVKTVTLRETPQASGLTTTYTYKEPTGHSSGTLFSRPRYAQVIRNNDIMQIGYGSYQSTTSYNAYPNGCINPESAGGTTNCQRFQVSPASTVPLTTTQGNHIGYSRVTVTRAGAGRTEYQYYASKSQELNTPSELGKVYDDVCYRTLDRCVCDRRTPSLPAPPERFEFNRGQLASETTYDEQGRLVKLSRYTYAYDSSRIVTPGWTLKTIAGALLGCTYERRGYWKKQTGVVETSYSSNGDPFTTAQTTYYESLAHHQPTRQTKTSPAGQLTEERYQYAADFLPTACAQLEDGTLRFEQDRTSCDATLATAYASCSTMGCKYDAYIAHILRLATIRTTYVAYRRQYFTDPTNAYQTAHDQAKSRADGPLSALLQLQDDGHQEVVETSQWRNQYLLGASLTTFGPSLGEPSAICPAQQFELSLSSPAATFISAAIAGTSLSRDPRYASTPEMTFRFNQGNLVELRAKTGIITSYLWDYHATLPIAKAIGVDYLTLRTAYNGRENLRTLRTAPALAHALLTTYLYRPLVGMTTQTDPTGRALLYEYDGLGRLVRTRDEQGRILSQQQYHYAGGQ